MLTPIEKIILSLLVLLTGVLFLAPVVKRIMILARCQPVSRTDSLPRRFFYTVSRVFLQLCTLKDERPWSGAAHLLIFYGALAFDTMTVNHVIEGYVDGFYLFGSTVAGRLFSASVDLFSLTVLAGVTFFAVRRFFLKPPAYNTGNRDSAMIYTFIVLAVATFVVFNMFSVASHPGRHTWAFLSRWLAGLLGVNSLPETSLEINLKISYWLHALAVFSFVAYVPHSKYFHLFAGPVNLFFRRSGPSASMKPINLETAENFGLEKASDITWKDALDAYACVECGRCQDVCPAFQSGQSLSPKMVIYNLERHLLAESKKIIRNRREELPPLIPGVFTEEEIWACTTCGACLHACPFDIEHPDKLLGLRQNLVLGQGRFPAELRGFFRKLEIYGNSWGYPESEKTAFISELGVKTLAENPAARYALWLGCFGLYDERGRKIARSMVKILQSAGLDFALVGKEECCCGDSARRLGNEYLFQALALENLKTFSRHNLEGLITFCPHGYNVFKNEYPALLEFLEGFDEEEKEKLRNIRVISHLELLAELLASGRVSAGKLQSGIFAGIYTVHDSCYYGRHNRILDEPRKILKAALPGKLQELRNSREHSFCCGAGGGLMWTEQKPGNRVNHQRCREIVASRARLVATSCPYCLTMLEDGFRDLAAADIAVMDVAEILASALTDNEMLSES